MTKAISAAMLLALLVSLPAVAGDLPYITAQTPVDEWRARPVGAAAARVDTVDMLGGPGRFDGRFEDAQGQPDWHGWTHEDATAGDSHWHVSEFMAIGGQYSLWCGRYFGDDPGYGNDWDESMVFTHRVADPGTASTVRWRATLRNDTEIDYDFTYFSVNRGGAWIPLVSVDGDTLLFFDETLTFTPADYTGPAGDEIQLRVRFDSDGAWSDHDGIIDTDGACQLDDLLVEVNGQVVCDEDLEDGVSDQWHPSTAPVGDFAALYAGLQDLDACRTNRTVQVAFIDDGHVVPGTGGSPCITWCYGPGGYVVNHSGGLAGPSAHLINRVASPVMPWPAGADAMNLAFTWYAHEAMTAGSPGMLAYARVRSTADPLIDPIDDQPWRLYPWYMYGGPEYKRVDVDLSTLLVPGRVEVQVALEVGDFGYLWGVAGDDGTPAPYFDDVRCFAYPYAGPAVDVNGYAVAQDNFPEIGDLDLADLARNSIRFDSMMNLAGSMAERIDPGDSLVITVQSIRAGSVLDGLPNLHVCARANPLFDGVRQLPAGFSRDGARITGAVIGRPCADPDPQTAPRYWFDLPDTGFFFPGDVIHYYFEARDDQAGDIGTTLVPGDTTGFSDFGEQSAYANGAACVRGLPSLRSTAPGDQPAVLYWEESSDRPELWRLAFGQLGWRRGRDYDFYLTRDSSGGTGNGLGGRATSAVIAGYETVILETGVASNMTVAPEDARLLSAWFARGGKHALLTGDGLVTDLQFGNADVQAFADRYLGVQYAGPDVGNFIAQQVSPTARAVAGNGVIASVDRWIAYGGCPGRRLMDAVVPLAGTTAVAEFLDPAGLGGQYPFAAALIHRYEPEDATVVLLPYTLTAVREAPGANRPPEAAGIASRALILDDILTGFGQGGSVPPVAVAPGAGLVVRAAPNPFNPRVVMELALPRAGDVAVRVYDLRGALVRTLVDEAVPAGTRSVVWDGTADGGRPLASGVYFCEVRAAGEVRIEKLTLVR